MEEYLTRQEIRRLCDSVVGNSTDGLVNSQQVDQMNAWIDLGAQKVAEQSRWIALKRRSQVWCDQESTLIPYSDIEKAYWLGDTFGSQYRPGTYNTPADPWQPLPDDLAKMATAWIGAGNIIEVAVWDSTANEYQPVDIATIPAAYDQSRLPQIAAETQLTDIYNGVTAKQTAADVNAATGQMQAARGMPRYLEPRLNGLVPWPLPDKRYVLMVRYAISASWSYYEGTRGGGLSPLMVDQIPSRVDGVAIQHFVINKMYLQQGDMASANAYRQDNASGQDGTGEFWSRIKALKGWQNTGQRIPIDSSCTFDEDNRDARGRSIPRWNNVAISRSGGNNGI